MTQHSSPQIRQLRLLAGLVMAVGLGSWMILSVVLKNMPMAMLFTLLPASAAFCGLMVYTQRVLGAKTEESSS
ncbi:MAG: hypothetical protein AAFX09_09505 [Pseudomonadota bacterium]